MAVVAILLVDASIFLASTVVAWRAMRHFDRATTDYRQVRRVSL